MKCNVFGVGHWKTLTSYFKHYCLLLVQHTYCTYHKVHSFYFFPYFLSLLLAIHVPSIAH